MTSSKTEARVLLLVEDNLGDAELFSELVVPVEGVSYQILHVPRMKQAVQTLRTNSVDVVVLDLSLPDCAGVDSVCAIREASSSVPIVVLTGSDDEELANRCIDAGAQDYLSKNEIRAHNLRRAIGYAITRLREAQLREVEQTLAGYRALSSSTQTTSVTAALTRSGAILMRLPDSFGELVEAYARMLAASLLNPGERTDLGRQAMEAIVTCVGDLGGGPRDLLDIHLAALELNQQRNEQPASLSVLVEGRLIALEMMGLLVDYYRVGHRRRLS